MMTASSDHDASSSPPPKAPRDAFATWLNRDLRRHFGAPVTAPLPPGLAAAVEALLRDDDQRRSGDDHKRRK